MAKIKFFIIFSFLIFVIISFSSIYATTEVTDVQIDTTGNVTADWFNGLFNWISGDDWNLFDGSTLLFNESKLSTQFFNVSTLEVVTGTPQGSIADIRAYDNIPYNVSEVGSDLELRINFTEITEFNQLIVRYKSTDDDVAHDMFIELYDVVKENWEGYGVLPDSLTYHILEFGVFDFANHIDSTGTVQMRFHQDEGAPQKTHNHEFDWVTISKGFGTPVGQEIDPEAIHKDGKTPLTDNWDAGVYNITADLFKGLFNWTVLTNWLSFDGATLSINQTKFNESTDDRINYYGLIDNESYLSTYNSSYATYAQDIYVNESGDIMTGPLTINDSSDYSLNVSGDLYVNGTSGYVGIGTTTPGALLDIDISGGGTATALNIDSDSTNTLVDIDASALSANDYAVDITVNSGARGLYVYSPDDWAIYGESDSSYGVYGRSDSSYGVYGRSDSGYGIYGLIYDAATNDVSYAQKLSHTTSDTAAAGFGTGIEFELEDDGTGVDVLAAIQVLSTDATAGAEHGAFAFLTADIGDDGLAERMRIDEDGNVGIGTTSPTHTLNVVGNANITGTLYVSETNISTWMYNETIGAYTYTDTAIANNMTVGVLQGLLNATDIYSTYNATYANMGNFSFTDFDASFTLNLSKISQSDFNFTDFQTSFDLNYTYPASSFSDFNSTHFQSAFDLNFSAESVGDFFFTDFYGSFNLNITAWEVLVNASYLTTYNATYASIDTNASSCGSNEYLDGDGACITADSTGQCAANAVCEGGHTHPASEVTTGTFGTGSYVIDTNLTVQTIAFEGSALLQIYDNVTCIIWEGSTATFEIC